MKEEWFVSRWAHIASNPSWLVNACALALSLPVAAQSVPLPSNAVKDFGAVWLADSRFSLRGKMSFRGAKSDHGAITQFNNP